MIELKIILSLLSTTITAAIAGTSSTTENTLSLVYIEKELDPLECHEVCGCDQAYIYNDTIKECVINMAYMLEALEQTSLEKAGYKYEAADHDIANDDGMAKNIRVEAEQIFQGIIISVIIFIVCASACVVAACIYCCYINYSDRKLKNDVNGMARKMKKSGIRVCPKTKLQPKQESCNVIVGDAGLFVV